MPKYLQAGAIPPKRHTQFRIRDGTLYSEQLFSTEGFSSDYSLLYHHHPPTQITKTDKPFDVSRHVAEETMLQHRSFRSFDIKPEKHFLTSRKPVLVNKDCHMILAAPQESMDSHFYKNADADEMIFVHEGSGVIKTQYGELKFGYGDYVILPGVVVFAFQS